MTDRPSKAVLLITGAWQVPEHYRKVTDALTSQGLRVICPLLPTNNNIVPPSKCVSDDVALVQDVVSAEVANGTHLTVLVHSYGGIVATAALADFALPHGARSKDEGKGGVVDIIFMAAFLPMENESLAGIFGRSLQLPPWLRPQENGTIEVDEPAHHLYNDLPGDEQKHELEMLVAHPTVAQFTDTKCEKAAWRVTPVSYLICEGDTTLPESAQEMMIGRLRKQGVEVREFRCGAGHSPFLSMPDKVVEVVLEVMSVR